MKEATMIVTAQDLLAAFDALPADEKRLAVAELLRRSGSQGDLPEAAFDELAAELFRSYDSEEAARAAS
jgi:hypothetical protein